MSALPDKSMSATKTREIKNSMCSLCGKLSHTDKVLADQCRLMTAILGQGWGNRKVGGGIGWTWGGRVPMREEKADFERNDSSKEVNNSDDDFFTPCSSFEDENKGSKKVDRKPWWLSKLFFKSM